MVVHIYEPSIQKAKAGDRRNGSAIKSTGSSYREPRFDSQEAYDSS